MDTLTCRGGGEWKGITHLPVRGRQQPLLAVQSSTNPRMTFDSTIIQSVLLNTKKMSLILIICRETQGDGKKSTEEESPLTRTSGERISPDKESRGEEKRPEGLRGSCWLSCHVSIMQERLVLQQLLPSGSLFLGWWNTTRATLLWVSMLRTLWLHWTQTGKITPSIGVILLLNSYYIHSI